jgi:hypothetical protein
VKAPGEDEEEDPELPFATAIGSAVALSDGFAAGGVSEVDGRTQAFVAFVPLDGKPGHTVFLGAVHGDPDPPLVAADGERVLVAVETSDASGRLVELFRVPTSGGKPERGAELTEVGEGGVGLATGETSGVVVWSAKKGSKTTLRSAAVKQGAPSVLLAPIDIAGTSDAESPVLKPRPGGFWLAWISERGAPDAGVREPRVLSVVPLHADGTPNGSARAVSGDTSHVIAFDAATLPDGALGLAWREDDATPGVETGGLELARVGMDGAVQRGRAAADETLSAGAPSLVREAGTPGQVWLLVPGEDDRMRMAVLAPNAVSTSPFVADDSLRGAEILAALPGKRCKKDACAAFLLARSKRRAVELGVTECDRLRP